MYESKIQLQTPDPFLDRHQKLIVSYLHHTEATLQIAQIVCFFFVCFLFVLFLVSCSQTDKQTYKLTQMIA